MICTPLKNKEPVFSGTTACSYSYSCGPNLVEPSLETLVTILYFIKTAHTQICQKSVRVALLENHQYILLFIHTLGNDFGQV